MMWDIKQKRQSGCVLYWKDEKVAETQANPDEYRNGYPVALRDAMSQRIKSADGDEQVDMIMSLLYDL